MPDDPERTSRLEKFLKEEGIVQPDRGQYFMYGMVLQQVVDHELGDSGNDSLIHHTQTMLTSGIDPERIRAMLKIFELDSTLVDKLLDPDCNVGFDVGDSPFDSYQ